jgi:hypothetical protein
MSPKPFHLIWREQCEAAKTIQARYGVESALDYLVGEKLMNFVEAAEECSDFVQELPAFVAEVRKLFTLDEIRGGFDRLERRLHAERAAYEEQVLESDAWTEPTHTQDDLQRIAWVKAMVLKLGA